MPKDKKDKIIFAGVIFLAFLFANILSNDGVKDFFNKSDDEIVMTDQEQAKIEEDSSKEENIDDLSINDKKVYISGEIINSGVYDIKDGDRLDDLVKRAGGFTEKADLDSINLAMRLEDQMKIYIPNIDENQNISAANTNLGVGAVDSTNSDAIDKVLIFHVRLPDNSARNKLCVLFSLKHNRLFPVWSASLRHHLSNIG